MVVDGPGFCDVCRKTGNTWAANLGVENASNFNGTVIDSRRRNSGAWPLCQVFGRSLGTKPPTS